METEEQNLGEDLCVSSHSTVNESREDHSESDGEESVEDTVTTDDRTENFIVKDEQKCLKSTNPNDG